ncbi:MAG: HAD family hydrolase [Aaplasma endosymbiont of Hyalomma asiaticum]
MKYSEMDIKPPVAVVFDWCNTIVRTDGIDLEILQEVMKSMQCDHIELSGIPHSKIEGYLAGVLGTQWKKAAEKYEGILRTRKNVPGPLPNDNVPELLEFLHKKNISMAIVSNKQGARLRSEVQSLGLSKYFAAVLGAGDTVESKPSPEPVFAALEVIGVPPSNRVFFVGDSTTDIESARRAQCCPIAYDNASIKGVLSFSNFRDFGDFVAGLLG